LMRDCEDGKETLMSVNRPTHPVRLCSVLLLGLVVLSLGACGTERQPSMTPTPLPHGGPPPAAGQNLRYRQLAHGFATQEACESATQGGLFNCFRFITVCANGGYDLIVTDIDDEGLYTRDGDTLQFTQQGEGDGPLRFTATLSGNTLSSAALGGKN